MFPSLSRHKDDHSIEHSLKGTILSITVFNVHKTPVSQVLLSSLLYAGGDEDIEPLNNSPKVKRLLNSSIQDSASTVWPHCFPYTWAGVSFKTYLWDGQKSPRIDGGLSSGAKTPGTQASAVPGVGEAWWSWGGTRVAGENSDTGRPAAAATHQLCRRSSVS